MEFYCEFKTRESNFNSGFTNGMTMTGSDSVNHSRKISEDKEKTVFEYMGNTVECFHIKKGNVTECYSRFVNNGEESVTLDMISSFAIRDIYADVIHRAASFWSAEGRLISQRLVDMNMEQAWLGASVRFEKFGQLGSMPVRKWFPFIVLENTSKSEFIGVQLYCSASWQIELFRREEPLSLSGGLADYDFGHWCKKVEPKEVFITPKAVIATGKSLEEVCDRLVKAQKPRIAEPDKEMPVIFNEYCTTWGDPTEEKLRKIAERLDGSGVKYLVIDSGWYKEEGRDWSGSIGDWNISKAIFPEGLKKTTDMIKSHGLIPGLWFEHENVGWASRSYHNTDHLLKRFGTPIASGGRRFWDMRDPWVTDYLKEKVIGILKENGFGYLKIDYNDSIGIGCDGAESLGEGLRQTVAASEDFLRILAEEMPELVIENCSSGGHRLVPSMMELSSMASFSDAHECKCIPIIAANLHRLIRPEQSQIWAVLKGYDDIHRIRYSLCAGFLGRLCLSGDIFDISEENWKETLSAIAFYDKVKEIIRSGFTRVIRCSADSYGKPKGYQAVLRTFENRELLVVHTFENGANPDIDDLLEGKIIVEEWGSELSEDFRGKVFLLEH